uniref:sphingosine kinase 2-like n=1 Tax=Myxine glutinosa TaxID=7769 RepID=UPI00358F163E
MAGGAVLSVESAATEAEAEGPSTEVLLRGEVGGYPRASVRYVLSLTPDALHVQRQRSRPEAKRSARSLLPLRDVVGCRTLRARNPNTSGASTAAYLAVYSYPRGGGGARRRAVRTLRVDAHDDLGENVAEAARWETAVRRLVSPVCESGHSHRRMLLLVNPCSGTGRAIARCRQIVLPILEEAGIEYELKVTERQNHAWEMVQSLKLEKWDALVIVSGDGLLYEVINGLMARSDWEQAIKIPLGIVPAGSGNALAGAINHYTGHKRVMGDNLLTHLAFLLCKGACRPLDLVSVTTSLGRRLFSFLCIAWGFVSDVDIESERFRLLGGARFTLGTLARIASLRTYRGRLSYLPTSIPGDRVAAGRNFIRSATLGGQNDGPRLAGRRAAMHRNMSDGALVEEMGLAGKWESTDDWDGSPPQEGYSSSCQSPDSETPPFSGMWQLGETVQSTDQVINRTFMMSNGGELGGNGDGPGSVYGPPDDLLPLLDEPIPQHWRQEENDYVLVLALYQSHLAADLLFSPLALPDDGIIHLWIVRAGISRRALLRFFMSLARGRHLTVDSPHVAHITARAFRLEPLQPGGIITVDGEQVEYGPLQAQIHPHLARLIVGLQKSAESPNESWEPSFGGDD